jgi:lipid II:glycine glycyltransferase (peptidoglycan interpeptide bridge formation enzyme)
MELTLLEEDKWGEWDKFNHECATGNVFQTQEFACSLKHAGMDVNLLIARDDKGGIKGGTFLYLPFSSGLKSIFNCMFVTSGPVLRNIEDTKTMTLLLKKTICIAKEKGAFKIELRTPFINHGNTIRKIGFNTLHDAVSCSFIVNLDRPEDELWRGLEKRTIRAIKKARREGITVKEADSEKELGELYSVYETWSKKMRGVFPLPKKAFEGLWKNLVPKGYAKFMVAKLNEKIIAETVFLGMKGSLGYFNNANLDEFSGLRPNHIIVWETMRTCSKNGYKILDLYGTPCTEDENHPQHGLYLFKRGFGGELKRNMQYYGFCLSPIRNKLYLKLITPFFLPFYKKLFAYKGL